MDQKIERIMRKVRALLARADENRNDNAHEREIALRQANALMDKYQIEATQLDQDEMGERGSEGIITGKAPWKGIVINSVSKLYGCYCYREPRVGGKTYVIGRTHWRHIVLDMSQYLLESIDREAKNQGKGRGQAYAHSFRAGAASAVCDTTKQISAARQRGETTQTSESTALVVVQRYATELKENIQWTLDQGLNLKVGRKTRATDRYAFSDGHRYGSSLSLNGQIGGTKQGKPLLISNKPE